MLTYTLRRLLWVPVVLLVVTALTFVLFVVVPPVDPAVLMAGKAPTAAAIAEVRHQFGLDKPIYAQYALFVKHLFAGDKYGWPGLGFSYVTKSSVRSLLSPRIGVTLTLAIGAALLWLVVGVSIGVVSAMKRHSIYDRLAMGFAVFFVSAPPLWLGPMFLWIFWFKAKIFPGTGYFSIAQYGIWTWFSHLILPWIVLAASYAAWYARMMRGTLTETSDEDYLRTARAKGVPARRIMTHHAVRASLGPILTMFGMDLGTLVGGAIIVEIIFNLQGLGQLVVTSISTGDFPVILAVTLVAAIAVTLGNVIVDVVRALIDPRVRSAVTKS